MDSAEFVDPYLISGTTVLRNLVGATTNAELAAAEADLSFARATQLLNDPVRATNDLDEFKEIHFRLFQDVYEWAGQVRTIEVKKDVPGAEFFMPFSFIELAAANCFQGLAADEYLSGLEREALPLIKMFDKVVTPRSAKPNENWTARELRRLSINPSDTNLS